jgi:archaemetzincin
MKRFPKTIAVIPVGEVPETTLKVIAAHVGGYLNFHAEVLPALKPPICAFDARRLQYDAGKILAILETLSLDRFDKQIGVFNQDLFVPIFTHVFGEARLGGKAALVSLFRLGKISGGDPLPENTVLERTAKVALHELGHLLNRTHCGDRRCLMHFSGSLEDLDGTSFHFCRYCAEALRIEDFGDSK